MLSVDELFSQDSPDQSPNSQPHTKHLTLAPNSSKEIGKATFRVTIGSLTRDAQAAELPSFTELFERTTKLQKGDVIVTRSANGRFSTVEFVEKISENGSIAFTRDGASGAQKQGPADLSVRKADEGFEAIGLRPKDIQREVNCSLGILRQAARIVDRTYPVQVNVNGEGKIGLVSRDPNGPGSIFLVAAQGTLTDTYLSKPFGEGISAENVPITVNYNCNAKFSNQNP